MILHSNRSQVLPNKLPIFLFWSDFSGTNCTFVILHVLKFDIDLTVSNILYITSIRYLELCYSKLSCENVKTWHLTKLNKILQISFNFIGYQMIVVFWVKSSKTANLSKEFRLFESQLRSNKNNGGCVKLQIHNWTLNESMRDGWLWLSPAEKAQSILSFKTCHRKPKALQQMQLLSDCYFHLKNDIILIITINNLIINQYYINTCNNLCIYKEYYS